VWAILVGIGGTLLTVFGVGFSQVRHLDPVASTYTQAAFVALSAVLGLAVMWRTRPSLADYGFRRPLHLDRALWLLPLFAVPVVLVALAGIRVTPAAVSRAAVRVRLPGRVGPGRTGGDYRQSGSESSGTSCTTWRRSVPVMS